jgi:hypothetical protein
MDSCWNSGSITNSQYICGGIIGQIQNLSTLSHVANCYNVGDVKGGYWVGGIVGNAAINRPIVDCWNAGTITGKNRVAGIVGYSGYGARISRCFNVGEIISTNTSAGLGNNAAHTIGGIAGDYAGYITDSYNAGRLRGISRVGGIMGSAYRISDKDSPHYIHHLSGCYNVGEFTRVQADSCGHIVGVHMQNNSSVWREHGFMLDGELAQYVDTLENCHYLNTINSKAIVEAKADQRGHSVAKLSKTTISDSYISPGDYCYPILITQTENPYALLYAVTVVPADADAGSQSITTDFHVGVPQGVTWTSNYSGLIFDGTDALFSSEPYEGKVTLTATIDPAQFTNRPEAVANPLVRQFIIQVKKPFTDAVNEIKAARKVKAVRYYNLQGVQVTCPDDYSGILVQVTEYTDGTRSSQSVVK